jgi:hypothetical protein
VRAARGKAETRLTAFATPEIDDVIARDGIASFEVGVET